MLLDRLAGHTSLLEQYDPETLEILPFSLVRLVQDSWQPSMLHLVAYCQVLLDLDNWVRQHYPPVPSNLDRQETTPSCPGALGVVRYPHSTSSQED
jgi:hypothetical protein